MSPTLIQYHIHIPHFVCIWSRSPTPFLVGVSRTPCHLFSTYEDLPRITTHIAYCCILRFHSHPHKHSRLLHSLLFPYANFFIHYIFVYCLLLRLTDPTPVEKGWKCGMLSSIAALLPICCPACVLYIYCPDGALLPSNTGILLSLCFIYCLASSFLLICYPSGALPILCSVVAPMTICNPASLLSIYWPSEPIS